MWFLSEESKQPNGEHDTMADELGIGLAQLLGKAHMDHDADFLKEGLRALSQALMEVEVEAHIGAGRHERAEGAAVKPMTPLRSGLFSQRPLRTV